MKPSNRIITLILKIVLISGVIVFAIVNRYKENHFLEYLSYGAVVLITIFPGIDKLKEKDSAKKSRNIPRTPWQNQRDYDFFVGREFFIQELMDFFSTSTHQLNTFLLYAAGGIGKTALSRHVIELLKQQGIYDSENIIWLKNRGSKYDASNDDFELLPPVYPTYESLIIDVARTLNIEGGSISDLARCEMGIRKTFASVRLLLILDGIEDSKESDEIVNKFQLLFSGSLKTRLLITSRKNFSCFSGRSRQLEPFTFDETKLFINKFVQQHDVIRKNLASQGSNVEMEIHNITEGNPLTLKVFLSHLLFSSYQELMQRIEEHKFEGLNQYLYSSTWNRLKSQNPLTLDVLYLLAERRNRKGLPAELIRTALDEKIEAIEKSLNQLYEASMIEIEPDRSTQLIKLHSNIRIFVLSKMKPSDKT